MSHIPVHLSTSSVYPENAAYAFDLAQRLGYDGVEVMVWTKRNWGGRNRWTASRGAMTTETLTASARAGALTQQCVSRIDERATGKNPGLLAIVNVTTELAQAA